MSLDEELIIATLLGTKTKRIIEAENEGVIPPFLVTAYARVSAAQEAAELQKFSPRLLSALLRAAFEDEEEDVRAAARHSLIIRVPYIGDIVHLSLTQDKDPYVRESSIDEALEIIDESRRVRLLCQAVEALSNDEIDFVRTRAMKTRELIQDDK